MKSEDRLKELIESGDINSADASKQEGFIQGWNEALHIHGVVWRSEQLICDTCKSGLIDYPDINRRTCRCGGLGYNVTK